MKNMSLLFLSLIILSCSSKSNVKEENGSENITIKKINNNELMSFEERRNKFVSEGFGFTYKSDEMENIDIFILNHDEPQKKTEEIIKNRYDGIDDKIITLEYNNFITRFYVWNKRPEGHFPHSRLLSIISKDDIEYMFGIKNGITVNELIKIIGEVTINEDGSIWLSSYNGNVVTIELENNILKYIIWEHSLE
jgi:hypothetical protein